MMEQHITRVARAHNRTQGVFQEACCEASAGTQNIRELRSLGLPGRARLRRSDGVKDFRPGSSVGPRDVVARHRHAMIVSAGRWETSRRCKAASVRLRLSRDR